MKPNVNEKSLALEIANLSEWEFNYEENDFKQALEFIGRRGAEVAIEQIKEDADVSIISREGNQSFISVQLLDSGPGTDGWYLFMNLREVLLDAIKTEIEMDLDLSPAEGLIQTLKDVIAETESPLRKAIAADQARVKAA